MKSNTIVSSKHRNKELLFSSKGFNLGCWKKQNDAKLPICQQHFSRTDTYTWYFGLTNYQLDSEEVVAKLTGDVTNHFL